MLEHTHGGHVVTMHNNTGAELVDCREAARRYGCTMRYMRRLAATGRLNTTMVGGAYVFNLADVLAAKRAAKRGGGRHRYRAEGFTPG